MIDLTDRRVLVTGGSRGIGAATARLFARVGATVLVHYRRRSDAAFAVVRELGEISDRPHLSYGADLSEPAAVHELFDEVKSKLEGLAS